MNLTNPMNPINPGSDKILIVRTDRLGDVILTLPMARALKRASLECHISFLIRSYTQPIVERSPDVDEVFLAEPEISYRELVRTFRESNADTAFFPSPQFRLAMAAWLARIPKRVGTGFRWYSFLFTHRIFEHRKTAERHEAEYNLRMLTSLGISAPKDELPNILLRNEEREAVDEWLASHLGNSSAIFAVLHITNGGSTEPWPIQNFVELGRMMFERYGMTIILTGLRQEAVILDTIANSIGDEASATMRAAQVFAGHSVPELAALLERAEVVVASSTGPGHLAAALGANTIGLFSLPLPLSKERWGFRGPHALNLSPEPLVACPTCEHCTCMERLDVRSVWNAVEASLRSNQNL
jgi:heptosyltransferase-3